MTSRYTNLFRFFFAAADLCLLNMVHIILLFNLQRIEGVNNMAYFIYFLFCNMAWLVCGYGTSLYINDRMLDFHRYGKRTLKTFLIYCVVILLFLFVFHFNYSRIFVGLNVVGFGLALVASRILFIFGGYYLKGKKQFNKKVVVIGYNDLSKKLVDYFCVNKERVYMEGYFESLEKVAELSTYPILGNVQDAVNYAIENGIDEIYSTISPEKNRNIYELAATAEKNLIRFKFVTDFHLFINRKVYMDYVREIPILSLRPEPLEDLASKAKKRLFDLIFSAGVMLLILSWLTPIIALLIKLSSKGPVFFTQFRSGKNNKKFKCYKFRSLRINNERDTRQVTRNDNRMTKVGKFLRKTNLDELPQFWNVLLGNMSIVGPRPHMLMHTETYSKLINNYMLRHFIKPGITGWAQVNGYRGEIKEQEQLRKRIQYDAWYVEHWSLWLDFRIIFLTIYLTIKGDENAF